MSKLGDRLVMTLVIATGVFGLVSWILGALVYRPPEWLPWFLIPGVFALFVVAVLVLIWEGLDVMD